MSGYQPEHHRQNRRDKEHDENRAEKTAVVHNITT
jgi:hypothetical protein